MGKASLIVALCALIVPACPALAQGPDADARRSKAERLVAEFWDRVWVPQPDLTAIDDLLVEDFILTNAGSEVKGRADFKEWVLAFQAKAKGVHLEADETFANADGTRVTSRWRATGINNGVLGTPPDGKQMSFTGIAIWEIRWTPEGPKLAHNWVERSAWELYQQLIKGSPD